MAPPGTGKTHILEQLADDAGAWCIEITPSNLLVGGEAEVEKQAQEVFEALGMLRGAVVIFDEFERVLLKRPQTPDDKGTNVFSFLTASMLPKLKRLHGAAERGQIVYALLTNRVATLDRAAIRSGRFDAHLGIYYPDPLSRMARLWRIAARCVREWPEMPAAERWKLCADIARDTDNYTMEVLGRLWREVTTVVAAAEWRTRVKPRAEADAEWDDVPVAPKARTMEHFEERALRAWNDKIKHLKDDDPVAFFDVGIRGPDWA